MGQQGEPGLAGYEVRYLIISNQLFASNINKCLHVYDITHQKSLLGLLAFCIVIFTQHNILYLSLQGHQGSQGPMGSPGPKGEKVHLVHFV